MRPQLPHVLPGRVPDECPEWVRDLIAACMDASPAERPSARDIVDMLSSSEGKGLKQKKPGRKRPSPEVSAVSLFLVELPYLPAVARAPSASSALSKAEVRCMHRFNVEAVLDSSFVRGETVVPDWQLSALLILSDAGCDLSQRRDA